MNYVVVPKGSVIMFDSVVLTPEAYEQLCHQAQAERIKALEEEHKLALTLCQRIDDTVGGVKDFAECVDHQSTAYDMWRNAVEKVGEE